MKQRKNNPYDHPDYLMGKEEHWADRDRERNKGSFRRNFVAIIVVMVIIAIVLIAAAVTAIIPAITETQITAADTFAVSQVEQRQMEEYATKFAQGILVYAYCSDDGVSNEGKEAALQTMASNGTAHDAIVNLSKVNPAIAPSNFVPVTTVPKLMTTSQAYAGAFTYELDAVAADSSDTSDSADGSFIDRGYHMTLTFDSVTDEATGEEVWVITNASIQPK